MKSLWIIDAYNVIHRIPRFRAKLGSGLEAARNFLLSAVNSHFSRQKASVTVVFDGAEVGVRSGVSVGRVKAAFARPPRKADDVIKSLVDGQKNRSQVTVVSSDQEVYRYAKASGCNVISSEEFDRKMVSARTIESSEKEEPNLSAGELEEWRNLFK